MNPASPAMHQPWSSSPLQIGYVLLPALSLNICFLPCTCMHGALQISLGQGGASCMVLRYRGACILLDCALCPETILALPPHHLEVLDMASASVSAAASPPGLPLEPSSSSSSPSDAPSSSSSWSPRILGPLLQVGTSASDSPCKVSTMAVSGSSQSIPLLVGLCILP